MQYISSYKKRFFFWICQITAWRKHFPSKINNDFWMIGLSTAFSYYKRNMFAVSILLKGVKDTKKIMIQPACYCTPCLQELGKQQLLQPLNNLCNTARRMFAKILQVPQCLFQFGKPTPLHVKGAKRTTQNHLFNSFIYPTDIII